MPSLKQLEEFKSSFGSIAHETAILKAQNIPQDDFPLPDSGPEPSLSPQSPGGAPEVSDIGPLEDAFDFSAFLDTIPEPLSTPAPDLPGPEDLPAGEPPPVPFPEADPDEESLFSEDLFPGPENVPPAEDFSAAFPDLSEEMFTEAGAPAAVPEDPIPDDILGLSGSQEDATEGFDLGDESVDLSTVFAQNDSPLPEDTAAAPDPFDAFSLDEGPGAPVPPKEAVDAAGVFQDLEEFSLPGVDDVFGGKSPEKAGIPGDLGAEKAEDIQLSQEDLSQLRETLASYPLNLRIACEELIAEKAADNRHIPALVKLLVRGASPQEAASFAGKALGRTVSIPRGFEKRTGAELEEEQKSFSYYFTRKLLPLFALVLFFSLVAASLFYLIYRFIYTPVRADSIYRDGYERIEAGEFRRANERFQEALGLHRVKNWFYRYAGAFRDTRQYRYAQEKYDELLRYYPRDKRGVLEYAAMEAGLLRNYPKADSLLRRNILDFAVDDREALLALGDTNLAWAEIDAERYEEARGAYARLLERYGWEDPVVERMLRYFIRTDELGEVLPLQAYFGASGRRQWSPETQAELGGYLLDKRLEEVQGVPDEQISRIDGIRDILLKAAEADPSLPEAHYHLARYYNRYGSTDEERQALEMAVRTFDAALEESPRRAGFHIDAIRRYAQVLIKDREFFPAEEQITRGIKLYEDGISRRLLSPSPEFARLYAVLGDLEYFTKEGDMEAAAQLYERAERNGWAPGEIQYRLGSAYYHLRQWRPALERFFAASVEMPLNRRLLYALGNAAYMQGDYFAAQGYYNRLLDLLEQERSRFPQLSPSDRPEYMELAERLMAARNNLGVCLEALADHHGNNAYRSQALGLYAESSRAWDAITRNPQTMLRAGAGDLSSPGVNLASLNSRNALNPVPDYEAQIYLFIDKDVLEPSPWEDLVPLTSRLFDEINF